MAFKTLIFITITLCSNAYASDILRPSPKEPQCITEGLSCHDCWTTLNCINLGNGTLYPQIQTCPVGRSCKDTKGECEETGNYQCDNEISRTSCNSEGTFPDPFNCKKYYLCILESSGNFSKYERECTPGRSYDPFTKLCSNYLEGNCTSPVPVCNNSTQNGSLIENRNIFYTCESAEVSVGYNYLPVLHACSENYYYKNGICIDPFESPLDDSNKCAKVGRFFSSLGCKYYTQCTAIGGTPTYPSCAGKFSPFSEACITLDCDTCRG